MAFLAAIFEFSLTLPGQTCQEVGSPRVFLPGILCGIVGIEVAEVVILLGLIVFFFGTCVGSFLNVVVHRLNHNLSPLRGRSFCPRCKRQILWYDNIPLLSFIFLGGKCRFCHSPISWQYPLVELATGIQFFWISWWAINGCSHFSNCYLAILLSCYLVASLIAIFVSDLCYGTIPDQIVYPAIGLALLAIPFSWGFWPLSLLTGAGAALGFLLLVVLTRGKGMGMGDVKLAGLMGLILGWPRIAVALYLAFLTGAFFGVILVLLRKKSFGEQIPFGPFLVGATLVSLFLGETISRWFLGKI